jgi:hypothetical protein
MAHKDGDSAKRTGDLQSMNESQKFYIRIAVQLHDDDVADMDDFDAELSSFVHDNLVEIIQNPLTDIFELAVGYSPERMDIVE